ncbi:hypothetical protein LTR94_033306, partial [Friedmanniomyces endolithicus]
LCLCRQCQGPGGTARRDRGPGVRQWRRGDQRHYRHRTDRHLRRRVPDAGAEGEAGTGQGSL